MQRFEIKDGYIDLPPIEVKDEEQFVPIYLATVNTGPQAITVPYNVNLPLYSAGKNNLVSKESLKEQLITRLNYSYPDSYSLPYAFRNFSYSDISGVRRCFAGEVTYDYICTSEYLCALGLFLKYDHNDNQHQVLPTPYNSHLYLSVFDAERHINNIWEGSLVVVKAKHIPYIRACIFLQQPYKELPIEDIKILTTINETYLTPVLMNTSAQYGVIQKVHNMKYNLEMMCKTVSIKELLSYVVGKPKTLSLGETIKGAIECIEQTANVYDERW